MNVSILLQKAYENKRDWTFGQSKPNSNPIKPNLQDTQMSVTSILTKDYERNDIFAVPENKPNSNPISERPKMNANVFVTKDYENKTAFRPQKNKPNQTQFQTGHQPPPTSYLPPQFSLKFTPKNAPALLRSRCVEQEIFEKLLICTCFYSIIVLFYALYIEIHLSVDYGESAKCKLGTLFLRWYFGDVNTRYLLSKSANS